MASDGVPRKAIVVPDSLGLGHAARSLAIIDELRRITTTLDVTWLTAHPGTVLLEEAGENVHPFSYMLKSASESVEELAGHGGRRVNARKCAKRLLLAHRHNAAIIADVIVELEPDLVVVDGDAEMAALQLASAPVRSWRLVFVTNRLNHEDVRHGGSHGLREKVFGYLGEHRYTRFLEDRSGSGDLVFVYGDERRDGPAKTPVRGSADARTLSEEPILKIGFPLGFDPTALRDEDKYALKTRLGYNPDKPLVIATAGGTALGRELLEKVYIATDAMTEAAEGDIQVVLVTGPRLSPERLNRFSEGATVKGYVHRLYEHFAACDFAIIPGGLMCVIELAALRKPFLFVPIAGLEERSRPIFETLERYGLGETMSLADLGPNNLARSFKKALLKPFALPHAPVPLNGALQAAVVLAGGPAASSNTVSTDKAI